jgi:hypothetical protein
LGFGINGVFLAEPISNVLGGLACVTTMYWTVYRPLGAMETECAAPHEKKDGV